MGTFVVTCFLKITFAIAMLCFYNFALVTWRNMLSTNAFHSKFEWNPDTIALVSVMLLNMYNIIKQYRISRCKDPAILRYKHFKVEQHM